MRHSKWMMATVLAFLASSGPLQAGYATQSAVSGDGYVLAGNPEKVYTASYSDGWNPYSFSAGGFDVGPVASGASAGVTVLGALSGIHLFAQSVHAPDGLGRGGGTETVAAAEWLDVIHVSGFHPPPATLRLSFHISGLINLGVPKFGYADARVGLTNLTDVNQLVGGPFEDASSQGSFYHPSEIFVQLHNNGVTNTLTETLSGNNSNFFAGQGGAFDWDASFLVSYRSDLGGYLMNAYASARAIGILGDSQADFSHTIQLTNVTLPDGSPVSGQIMFDSGFQLPSAVPEPSSLVLISVGALGLVSGCKRITPQVAVWIRSSFLVAVVA
ncbi:MAG TPA: PEP-CTERM sorting domain-containing protein [Gemmataceae bacterium]|nr:PEP-CTERM sorting domain-containing protein [Gemmataceae bacterium]